jgi:DHA1 family bicyclomycin/chloramphenicol resistance-like MFS transporter
MDSESSQQVHEITNKGILTLVLSRGLTQLPSAVIGLLLVEIALSYNVQIGVAGQINTAAGLFSILFGLAMGVLSVKYQHKSLLFTGIILYVFFAVSSYFSTSLTVLIAVYSLVGIANALVLPMVNTLIGELVSPERRISVIGWTVGGMSLIYFIGVLSAGFLSNLGWKMTMVLVVVPVGVLTCIMCRNFVPSQNKGSENKISFRELFTGYINLLRNKSAIGCILGTVLSFSVWYFYLVYGASYFREVYQIGPSSMSVIMIFFIVFFIIGSLSAGRLVKRFNEKTSLLIFTGVLGIVTIFVFHIPNFWATLLTTLIACFSGGVMITVSSSYALSQIPEYSGTMMSLHAAADSFGSAISAGLGGTFLLLYGYGIGSSILGVFGVIGAIILLLFTSEQ